MDELINYFLDFLKAERNASPHTVTAYQRDLTQFAFFLKSTSIKTATSRDIRSWLGALFKEGAGRATIARKLSSLRTFYRFLIREGFIAQNPAKKIRIPKLEARLPLYLSVDEAFSMVELPQTKGFHNLRDRAILELLYSTGIRVSEASNINLEDISLSPAMIRVKGKGRKERIVPFGKKAREAITDYLPYREEMLTKRKKSGEKAFLINQRGTRLSVRTIERIVEKRRMALNCEKKATPHTFRHSMATHMLESGADLRSIQEILGHKNLATTQHYTHIDISQLAKIYDAAHPRGGKTKKDKK